MPNVSTPVRGLARVATVVLCVAAATAVAMPTAGASGPASGHAQVVISSSCGADIFCFEPSTISVDAGGTVTWVNRSGADHVIARCDASACSGTGPGTGTGRGPQAIDVPPGQRASFVVAGAGTYNYYCTIHGFAAMHGSITVAPVITTTTPPTTTASTIATAARPAKPLRQLARTGGIPFRLLGAAVVLLVLGFAALRPRRATRRL